MVFLTRLGGARGASLPGSWARLASGVGTLGVGGAWGAGKAANDGYQGSPGTRMVSGQAPPRSSTAGPPRPPPRGARGGAPPAGARPAAPPPGRERPVDPDPREHRPRPPGAD